ncbi:hypothetical protein YB2330_005038 [Saitoella coloradoensis]
MFSGTRCSCRTLSTSLRWTQSRTIITRPGAKIDTTVKYDRRHPEMQPYKESENGPWIRPRNPQNLSPKDYVGQDILYGRNTIEAALHADRREFHTLYVQESKKQDLKRPDTIMQLAKERGIPIVTIENAAQLGNLTGGKPHNGYVMICEELTPVEIYGFERVEDPAMPYKVYTAPTRRQSKELEAPKGPKRYPFWLFLDEITDPMNLGAILRTSAFFRVDGVIVSEKTSAPLSPVVSKASSGAMEVRDIYTVSRAHTFLEQVKSNGWKCIATASPDEVKDGAQYVPLPKLSSLLQESPVVLMLGSEGEGLRASLRRLCDYETTIKSAPGIYHGLDSLNVSVAASVFITGMLGVTSAPPEAKEDQ